MIDYEYKNHTKIQIKFEKRVVDLKELPKTTTLTPEQMRAHMKYTVFSPKKSLEKLVENFTNSNPEEYDADLLNLASLITSVNGDEATLKDKYKYLTNLSIKDNLYLAKQYSVQELKKQLLNILKNKDEALLKSKNALKSIENYTYYNNVENFKRLVF